MELRNPIDILIPLGSGSTWNNNELRYALRSIEKYASGLGRVFVVGDNPGFLTEKVIHISGGEIKSNKEARIAFKVMWAFQCTNISDDVAFWNDDYVLNAPVDIRTIDYFHCGDLAKHGGRFSASYMNSMNVTRERLLKFGKPTLDYDIHVPIIYNREKFLDLVDWWEASTHLPYGFVVKSTYANNVLTSAGPVLHDCKIRKCHPGVDEQIKDRWIFSYADSALRFGLKDWLSARFPEKSSFES